VAVSRWVSLINLNRVRFGKSSFSTVFDHRVLEARKGVL
jgi:hypothetical protein